MASPRSNMQLAERWAEYIDYLQGEYLGIPADKNPQPKKDNARFGSMSFEGSAAYSYRTIVANYHKGAVFLTSRSYSNTTSKQVGLYARAARSRLGNRVPEFYIFDAAYPTSFNNVQYILKQAVDTLLKVFEPRTQDRTNYTRVITAERYIREAAQLANYIGHSGAMAHDKLYEKYLELSQDEKVLALQAAYALQHGDTPMGITDMVGGIL